MLISELNRNSNDHQNKEVTVAGAVRATYNDPFPHFLVEDESGALICRPKNELPWLGGHVEITGLFLIETPDNCGVELTLLHETNRAYVGHPTNTCNLATCEFATNAAA